MNPSREQIEAGALAILNARIGQKGLAPLSDLDILYPEVLLEVIADSEAALRSVECPADADLLAACKKQHAALDMLFATLIARSPAGDTFHPSKSGAPWEAMIAGREAIAKAEGSGTSGC